MRFYICIIELKNNDRSKTAVIIKDDPNNNKYETDV